MNRKLRVGLNGLGRIGRHLFKIFIDDPLIELITGVNEINPDLNNWVYTLNYDSIYGKAKHPSFIKMGKSFAIKNRFSQVGKMILAKSHGRNGVLILLLIAAEF